MSSNGFSVSMIQIRVFETEDFIVGGVEKCIAVQNYTERDNTKYLCQFSLLYNGDKMAKVILRDVDGEEMVFNSQQEAIETMAEALGLSYPIGLGEWSDTAI